jgi:hypothetical protein
LSRVCSLRMKKFDVYTLSTASTYIKIPPKFAKMRQASTFTRGRSLSSH